jgi:uncharacterized protein YjbI with pentapeptide repeats
MSRKHDLINQLIETKECPGCDFSGITLEGLAEGSRTLRVENRVDLEGVNLERATFRGANLLNVSFNRANLERVDFGDAQLSWVYFNSANLRRANFQGARGLGKDEEIQSNFENADLERANLRRVNFTSTTTFNCASLVSANLQDAKIYRAEKADFRGTDLQGCEMIWGHFSDSDFRGAILRSCNLQKANLSGAKFNSSEIVQAELDGLYIDREHFDKNFAQAGYRLRVGNGFYIEIDRRTTFEKILDVWLP